MFRVLNVFLTLALLAGCGGSIDEAAARGLKLRAAVVGCDRADAYDSGYVVYVVVERNCGAIGQRRSLRLHMSDSESTITRPSAELVMQDGDEQDQISIPGLGTRRVGLYREGQWRRIENGNSWQPMDGPGLLLLKGELFLLGGWLWGPTSNEVWKTRDLVHWEFLGKAPWPPRHGAGWLVNRERLYVVGGDWLRDAWSSADGIEWTQHSANAPFGTLYTPNAVSLDGRIVLYGGQGGTEGVNRVWESADGAEWRLLQGEAPWMGRGLIHGGAVFDGRIYLVGGGVKSVPPGQTSAETTKEFSDIWSSADGISWQLEATSLGFKPRTHFSIAATPRGCYVSDGSVGVQAAVSNELFHAEDCVNFAPVRDAPPLQPRHASAMAYFNGSLVILGGPPAGGSGTDIWQYFP